jgi:hypothetical protein
MHTQDPGLLLSVGPQPANPLTHSSAHLGVLIQRHAAPAHANEDAVRLRQVVDLDQPQVDAADEPLVAQHRGVVPVHLRHLADGAAVDAQVAGAGLVVPLQVQLLQLGDVHQACLQVLVGALHVTQQQRSRQANS